MELDPAEFAHTAQRAIAACAGREVAAQARLLAEDGLLGILAAEEVGGLGLGLAYAVPVAAAAGARLIGFPLIETVLLAAALPDDAAAPLVAGEHVATIAWAGTARREGGRLAGTVGRAPLAASCDAVLVRIADGGAGLVRIGQGVAVQEVPGLDVDAPEYELVLSGAAPELELDAAAADALRGDALVLWAAASMGAAETCLAMAAEHVATRQQFGRPLVAFQALRHALARQKLAVENIRSAVTRALALAGGDGGAARRAAFVAAMQYGPSAIESALQLHGGMGFTWDVPVHRHLRRVRSWEAQGDAPGMRRAIADTLLEANC